MKKGIRKLFTFVLVFCTVFTTLNLTPFMEMRAEADDSVYEADLSNLPAYPKDGQTYWVIFKEGWRNNRIEMASVDATVTEKTRAVYGSTLYLKDGTSNGVFNQYYLSSNGMWVKLGTSDRFSHHPAGIIASNLDVYNESGELLVGATEYKAGAAYGAEDDYFNAQQDNVFEGSTYEIFAYLPGINTIVQAEEYCESLGGHLACINSKEENDFLYRFMRSRGYESAYFGYNDEQSEGTWEWINGEISDYTNWHTDEPNGGRSENFAMFYYKFTDGTWNDGQFGNGSTERDGKVFLCEWDGNGVSHVKQELYTIRVNDRQGNVVVGATVKVKVGKEEEECLTNSKGVATFDLEYMQQGAPVIEVSKEGYRSYSNADCDDYALSEDNLENIIILKEDESELVLTRALYRDSIAGIGMKNQVNVLIETKEISATNFAGMGEAGGYFILNCQAADYTKASNYRLLQAGKEIATSKTGYFTQLKVTAFQPEVPIDVEVEGKNGERVQTRINLNIVQNLAIDATSFKFGKSVEFTVSDEIPVLGGTTLSLNLPISLPLEIYLDSSNTLHVGYNADFYKNTIKDGEPGVLGRKDVDEDRIKEVKETVNDLKNLVTSSKGGEDKGLVDRMKSYQNQKDSKAGVPGLGEISMNVLGYGEGKYDPVNGSTIKGYICVTIQYTISKDGQYFLPVGPVVIPLYYEVEFSVGAQLEASASFNLKTKEFDGEVPVTITPGVKVTGAVGCKILNAGIYGSLQLPIKFMLIAKSTSKGLKSVDLAGDFGATATVGFFTGTKSFANHTWHLYTASDVRTMEVDDVDTEMDFYDMSNYKVADFSYLSNQRWAGDEITLMEADTEFTALMYNTYKNMQPVIGNANGTPVVVWINGNTERGTYNVPELVYSVYEQDGFHTYRAVDEVDTTADNAPYLFTASDKNLYLIYQSSNINLQDGEYDTVEALAEAYAKAQAIYVSRFDNESGKFVDSTKISADGYYNYLPRLTEVNGVLTAVWARNGENFNLFGLYDEEKGQSKTAQIVKATYDSSADKWSISTVSNATNLGAVLQLGADGSTGTLEIAATVDEDNNLNTSEDVALYVFKNNTKGKTAQGNIVDFKYSKAPGYDTPVLTYSKEDSLYAYTTDSVKLADAVGSEYTILNDRILTLVTEENGSNLYSMKLENGAYGNPSPVTVQDDYVQDYSAVECNGNIYLMAALDSVNFAEDAEIAMEEKLTLAWTLIKDRTDLAVVYTNTDEKTATLGEKYELQFEVKNQGNLEVSEFTAQVTDKNGKVVATQNYENVPAVGESSDYVIELPVLNAEEYDKQYTVTITAAEDYNAGNDSAIFNTGYRELSIEANSNNFNGTHKIDAIVTNNSIFSAKSEIQLFTSSSAAEPVYRIATGVIPAGEKVITTITVTDEMKQQMENKSLFVKLVTEGVDCNEANNEICLSVIEYAVDQSTKLISEGTSLTIYEEMKLGLNYYVSIPASADAGYYTVTVTDFEGQSTKHCLNEYPVSESDTRKVTYRLTNYVNAAQMTDQIQYTITNITGVIVASEKLSVKEYAMSLLTNNIAGYTKWKPLVRAMLQYGAYAQTYFDYHIDALANADMDMSFVTMPDLSAEDLSAYAVNIAGAVDGVRYYGSSLIVGSTVTLRHYFEILDSASVQASLREVTEDEDASVGPYSEVQLTKAGGSNLYYLDITGLSGDAFDSLYEVKLADESKSMSVTYGVFSYINAAKKNDVAEELLGLLTAMYYFGQEMEKLVE